MTSHHKNGVSPSQSLTTAFRSANQSNSNIRYITVIVDQGHLQPLKTVQKSGKWESDFDLVSREFSSNAPLYVIFWKDIATERKVFTGRPRKISSDGNSSKCLLMLYSPDDAPVREKMIYASSWSAIKDLVGPAADEFQGSTASEFSYKAFASLRTTDESLLSETEKSLRATEFVEPVSMDDARMAAGYNIIAQSKGIKELPKCVQDSLRKAQEAAKSGGDHHSAYKPLSSNSHPASPASMGKKVFGTAAGQKLPSSTDAQPSHNQLKKKFESEGSTNANVKPAFQRTLSTEKKKLGDEEKSSHKKSVDEEKPKMLNRQNSAKNENSKEAEDSKKSGNDDHKDAKNNSNKGSFDEHKPKPIDRIPSVKKEETSELASKSRANSAAAKAEVVNEAQGRKFQIQGKEKEEKLNSELASKSRANSAASKNEVVNEAQGKKFPIQGKEKEEKLHPEIKANKSSENLSGALEKHLKEKSVENEISATRDRIQSNPVKPSNHFLNKDTSVSKKEEKVITPGEPQIKPSQVQKAVAAAATPKDEIIRKSSATKEEVLIKPSQVRKWPPVKS